MTQVDNNGNPPLYNALKNRNVEAAKILIAAGTDFNALSEEFKATLIRTFTLMMVFIYRLQYTQDHNQPL